MINGVESYEARIILVYQKMQLKQRSINNKYYQHKVYRSKFSLQIKVQPRKTTKHFQPSNINMTTTSTIKIKLSLNLPPAHFMALHWKPRNVQSD